MAAQLDSRGGAVGATSPGHDHARLEHLHHDAAPGSTGAGGAGGTGAGDTSGGDSGGTGATSPTLAFTGDPTWRRWWEQGSRCSWREASYGGVCVDVRAGRRNWMMTVNRSVLWTEPAGSERIRVAR